MMVSLFLLPEKEEYNGKHKEKTNFVNFGQSYVLYHRLVLFYKVQKAKLLFRFYFDAYVKI